MLPVSGCLSVPNTNCDFLTCLFRCSEHFQKMRTDVYSPIVSSDSLVHNAQQFNRKSSITKESLRPLANQTTNSFSSLEHEYDIILHYQQEYGGVISNG